MTTNPQTYQINRGREVSAHMLLLLICSSTLRLLFGPQEVQDKMKNAECCIDTWFAGGDGASEAVLQIKTAVRRRSLAELMVHFVCCFCCFFKA